MNKKLIFLISMALILIMAAVACGAKVDEEVVSFTDGAAEKVLIALNDQDYESFQQDMDDAMQKTITEQEFMRLSAYLKGAVGEYRQGSKKYSSSDIQGNMNVVIYTADYTEEPENVVVTVLVSVSDEGIYRIAGFWFDSPKLRETDYE